MEEKTEGIEEGPTKELILENECSLFIQSK